MQKNQEEKQILLDNSNEALAPACEGYGCIPAKFMFVGISAGQRGALISKVPLTKDASGRIFQRCLGRLGLSKSDEFSLKPELIGCYLTNLVKGRVLTPEGLNRLPTEDEITYWLPQFSEEIIRVNPRKIIALGKLVFSNLLDLYSDFDPRLVFVNHPRWYQAHGALSTEKWSNFEVMVDEYRRAIFS